jgi:hypothetical protein
MCAQVDSKKQFRRQISAIAELATKLGRNFKDDTNFFRWTDDMTGTVDINKYFCPDHNLWYLEVTGACSALYDLCLDSLLGGIGHVETTIKGRVKVMVSATGLALSSLESVLGRARADGLKVASDTFDPFNPLPA